MRVVADSTPVHLNPDCPYVRQRTDNNLFDLVDSVGSIWSLAKTGVSGLMDNPGGIQYSSTTKIKGDSS